jgi:hypothetical protein
MGENMLKHLLAIFLIGLTGSMCSITREVSLDGTHAYTTIQSAINASVHGDIVLVYPGRYIENVVITTNGISLESMEATTNDPAYIDSTIIDGNATSWCIKVSTDTQNFTIRGFSVTNGFKAGNGGGIGIFPSLNTNVINCHIFNNLAEGGAGIACYEASLTLSGVKVYGNRSVSGGGGLLIINNDSVVTFDPMNRCSIYNNIASAGQDIFVSDARTDIDVYLDTFTVENPSSYYAEYFNNPGYHCHLNFNILHAYAQEITHDLFVSTVGNDANDGLTPETSLKTIHTAIYRIAADSLNPKTVHILPGTYSQSANEQIFPISMKSWVNVEGSGLDETMIMGEHHPLFPSVNMIIFDFYKNEHSTISGMQLNFPTTLFQGKTIYGYDVKNLMFRNIKIQNMSFGNIDVVFFESATDCVFDGLIMDNITVNSGRLIYVPSKFSGVLRNCKITNCRSSAYMEFNHVAPLITIFLQAETTIENCLFDNLAMSDNDTQCISMGSLQFSNTLETLNIINSQFTNINGENGSVSVTTSNNRNINISNSTFADCTGSNYAIITNGNIHIYNSIFVNHTPYNIYLYPLDDGEHSNLTMDYNCLPNGQASIYNPGTGNQVHYLGNNIAVPSLFWGVGAPDSLIYSLAAGSPCIDTGTPDTTSLYLPVADLAGNYRIWNNRIDMGCYEYGSEPVGNDDSIHPEECGTLRNYPNPFNPSTTIAYSLKEDGKVSLNIYNIRGQLVKSLADGFTAKGSHSASWDGKDARGIACASGVYLYKLTTGKTTITRKMMILK